MTHDDTRTRKLPDRLGALTLLVIGLVVFALVPAALEFGAYAIEFWYLTGCFVAPLVASVAAWHTATECSGSGRRAWHCFALACFLWAAGTVVWAGYGWLGMALPFPSLADAYYILTAFAFMAGMFHYSLPGSGGSRIQVTNFALTIAAVVSIGFLLYFPVLAKSELGWLGATIAFAYPALWLSAFAFGILSYWLYVPDRRKVTFALILAAAGAHTAANFLYGFDVLNQTYSVGTHYDIFWIAAYALMALAALQHRSEPVVWLRPAEPARPGARPGEALIPALSLAAMLLAGLAARWPDLRPETIFVAPLVLGFAALLAVREHALFATERKLRFAAEASANQLAESEARLSGVLEHTTDGVIVVDRQWRITFANRKAADTALSARRFLGVPLWDLFTVARNRVSYENYSTAMDKQIPVEFETYVRDLDIWVEVHAFPSPDTLTVFFRDVTERRRLRENLVRLAQHDPLTDLANRALFTERLAAGLQGDRRHSDLILVMIDLDGFKEVNDSTGHLAGDCVLQQCAGRLTSLVRHGDTVARFGGDEFAIIQPGPVEPQGGDEVARRICESFCTPFDIEGSKVTLSVSIGIAMAPEHGTRPDELIRNADLALYRAKSCKETGSNYCTFDPDVDGRVSSPQSGRPDVQRPPALALVDSDKSRRRN